MRDHEVSVALYVDEDLAVDVYETSTGGGVVTVCEPRSRCACGKARYATEGEARRAVKRMKARGRDRSYAGLLHPYMCPDRKGVWHVGHTEE